MSERTRHSRRATHPYPRQCRGQERPEVGHIGLRSATLIRGKNEVRLHVAHDAQLRITMIDHGFPRAAHVPPPVDEVAAGGTRFQSGRIDRGPWHTPLATQMLADRRVEQAYCWNAR